MSPIRFVIEPDVPFSLGAAASFGFGPNMGRPKPEGDVMRLAFVLDGHAEHAGVLLRQRADGAIEATVDGTRVATAAERQVRRILSLDHPGKGWLAVGRRDPVIGRLQQDHPGLRPVLFHSPYEGAAWSVISHRRGRTQAAPLRTRLSAELGRTFELGGETLAAFPLPDTLATLKTFPGFEPQRIERLRGIARAALDGKLDADRLGAMPPEAARAELETLPGIGPFYADLILVRATGLADLLPRAEPRMLAYAGHFYGLRGPATAAQLHKIADTWTPYRTWGVVLLRVAGDRAGLPFEKREDRVRARMRP
jgi:DNA-3-methyladenine glycosylase II